MTEAISHEAIKLGLMYVFYFNSDLVSLRNKWEQMFLSQSSIM